MLTINDTYAGTTACHADQIDTAFADNGNAISGLGALVVKWAPIFGLRGEGVAGEIADETGWGTNWWSQNHNNILSIGVTGEVTYVSQAGKPDWQSLDGPQGRAWVRGYHFATVEAGLVAGLIHLATYVYGRSKANWPVSAQRYCGDITDDPRLPALLATNMPGTVKVFGDLGNGRFAAADGYGAGIISRANVILGKPHIITQMLGVPAETNAFYGWLHSQGVMVSEQFVNDGWVGRAGMQPEAIVHHVTDGDSVLGSIGWWRNAGVDASTQQLVAGPGDPDYPDGALVIARNDEDTAWANGVWGNPDRTNPVIDRWYRQGINPNRVTLSREHSGHPFQSTFPSEKQMLTSFYADLHWVAKYPGIKIDRQHFLRHSDIDGINRANCPGPRFDLDGLIIRVIQALQSTPSAELDSFLKLWSAIRAGQVSLIDGFNQYWHRNQ